MAAFRGLPGSQLTHRAMPDKNVASLCESVTSEIQHQVMSFKQASPADGWSVRLPTIIPDGQKHGRNFFAVNGFLVSWGAWVSCAGICKIEGIAMAQRKVFSERCLIVVP